MDHRSMARILARRFPLLFVATLVALQPGPLAAAQPARAVNHVVTTINDSGPGSLRQAITDANGNPGADVITFDVATDGTPIFLTGAKDEDADASGDLDILPGGLTIQGNGTGKTIIDGGGTDRVFHVCPGGGCTNTDAVVLTGMIIRNGIAGAGGGIANSGAPLTIQNSAVGAPGFGNLASSGGGIYAESGSTTIVDGSTVSANTASSVGGGIYNEGTLQVQNGSSVGGAGAGNQVTGGVGGGIYNAHGGTATVDASSVSSNTAASYGGGICNVGALIVQNGSTVGKAGAGNQASSDGGGGIANGSYAVATVDASAVSANTAGDDGGGIWNQGTLHVQNGSAVGGAGAANQATLDGGGIFNGDGGTVTVDGSVVSANTAGDGGGGIYTAGTLMVQNGSTIGGAGAPNQATAYGGGIFNAGTTTVMGSRILYNTATNLGGGGVYNDATAVRATVTGSCIAGNSHTSFLSEQAARQTATGNWWGAPTGPNTYGADTVSGNVDTSGYLTEPILGCTFYVYLSMALREVP